MDYYKNIDKLCCNDGFGFGRIANRVPAVEGISYTVLEDLAQEPVTLSEFKQHARVDWNTDDNLLEFYLKSAREYLEQWSQLSFGAKTIRFTALRVPDKWRLANGPYAANPALFGDILIEGGEMIDLTLTTSWPNLPDAIKVSICLEAATQYMIREGVAMNINGSVQSPDDTHDRALKLLKPYANITFP